MNKTLQWVAVGILALVATTGAILAFHYYSELESLRRTAAGNDDRAELQKKLWDSEKRRHELEAELAGVKDHPASADEAAQSSRTAGKNDGQQKMTDGLAVFARIRDNPDFQKSIALQARARLDSTYGHLFKSLGLSGGQLEKFKDLLVEKQMAAVDVMSAAISQGLDPRDPASRDDIAAMLADANRDVDDSIRQSLGDQKYSDYKNYEQTIPQRNAVNQLAQRLSYTDTPLQDYQSDALVTILSANTPRKTGQSDRNTIDGLGNIMNPNRTAPVTQGALDQAAAILSPPQLVALTQLQDEKHSQDQLKDLVNQAAKNPPIAPPAVAPVIISKPTH